MYPTYVLYAEGAHKPINCGCGSPGTEKWEMERGTVKKKAKDHERKGASNGVGRRLQIVLYD